jgi:hypothetical protein
MAQSSTFSDTVTTCGVESLGEVLYQLQQSYPEDNDCLVLFSSSWYTHDP